MKNPKKSIKNPTLHFSLQNNLQYVGESLNSLNLIFRTSSRAGKQVYSRRRPQTYHIARHSSGSVSTSSVSRNSSHKALSSYFLGESKGESIDFDLKIPTASRVIIGKFSSKRLSLLKLFATFAEGKAFTISWNE